MSKGAPKVSDLVVRQHLHAENFYASPPGNGRAATESAPTVEAPAVRPQPQPQQQQQPGQSPEAQIEIQDVLNSMSRYKWHGLIAALLIGLSGYFIFASGYTARYTVEGSIMRRESGLPMAFLFREEGRRVNRTFDGDVSYMRSERIAEVAQQIGRAAVNIFEIEPVSVRRQVLAHIRDESDQVVPGSDVEMISTEEGEKLYEFHNFGLTAVLPGEVRPDADDPTLAAAWGGYEPWRLRRLSSSRELPAEYLNGVELTADDAADFPRQTSRILVAWNTTGRTRFDTADGVTPEMAQRRALDKARATVRRRVSQLERFEVERIGTLAELVEERRGALGISAGEIAPHAGLGLDDASELAPHNPSTILLSYVTEAGDTVFLVQIMTAECAFLIDHRVHGHGRAVRQAAETRFLRLLAALEFHPMPGFRQLFESESQALDAVYRQGGIAEEVAPNWVAIDRRGNLVDPRRALSTDSDALIVPNPIMALLLDIYQGRATGPPPEEGEEGANTTSDLHVTQADREAIQRILEGRSGRLTGMVQVSGESSSGQLTLSANHENRHVAAFVANMMLAAFLADNARLSMERLRDDVRVRQQHLEKDRAQLRNMTNALGRLEQEANAKLLEHMVFGVFPAVDMSEGDLRRELSLVENEQTELALRIASLLDESVSLARRLRQLTFQSEGEIVAEIEREMRTAREGRDYDPMRDPMVIDVDRRINEIRLDLQRSIRRDTLEDNPLVTRKRAELQAHLDYRDELVRERRAQWEFTHEGLEGVENPDGLSLRELFEQRKQEAIEEREQAVIQALAELDAGWASELREALSPIEPLTAQPRVTSQALSAVEPRLPKPPEFETDPREARALFVEQDLRSTLAELESAVARWLIATRKRTDLVSQMAAFTQVFSPVETYRFDVEAFETRVRSSVTKLQEARVNATRLPDDYEWQRSADPRAASLEGRTLILAGIIIVALLGGLFVARLWDLIDARIKTDLQVKEITNLPILGHLPVLSTNERYIRISEDGRIAGRSIAANLFGILGSNVRHAIGSGESLSLCVTSAVPREGKSLISYDLACYYAIEGYRTCLLLADVRNPATEVFGDLESTVSTGFVQHLKQPDKISLDDTLYSTGIETMHVCFPGPVSTTPVRLFDDVRFPKMLAELKERFDVIIVDSPPVVPVADGTQISRHVDGTLLAVRVGYVLKRDLAMTVERLRFNGAPLLGVVVNADPTYRQRAYYYYYRRDQVALAADVAASDDATTSVPVTQASDPATLLSITTNDPHATNGKAASSFAHRNDSSGTLPLPSSNGSSGTLPSPTDEYEYEYEEDDEEEDSDEGS